METPVRLIRNLPLPLFVATLTVFLSSCATSTPTSTSADPTINASFNNILVIGVANDYDARARFERRTVSDLKAEGINATPMYTVGGGNKPIERALVEELVSSEGYDAVLISRVLSREDESSVKTGSTATKATHKEGRALDLFRYDYEELNEPTVLNMTFSVSISTELFAAANSQKVWSIESSISRKDSVDELIDEASETIVRRLRKDKLISN